MLRGSPDGEGERCGGSCDGILLPKTPGLSDIHSGSIIAHELEAEANIVHPTGQVWSTVLVSDRNPLSPCFLASIASLVTFPPSIQPFDPLGDHRASWVRSGSSTSAGVIQEALHRFHQPRTPEPVLEGDW